MPDRDQAADARRFEAMPASSDKSRLSVNAVTAILVLLIVIYPGWNIWFRLAIITLFAVCNYTPGLSRHSSIFCRCLLPLLIGAVCVEAYLLLNDWAFTRDLMKYFRFHATYNETFYSGVSTLYAIITALALVKGIEDFDTIKKIVADEAYGLRTIDEMARYFDSNAGAPMRDTLLLLRRNLLRYAVNVVALRDRRMKSDNLRILRDCQQQIAILKPADVNDEKSLEAMMAAHGEIGTLRSKRIGASGEKIPTYLIVTLWLMALGLVLPFMAAPPFGEGGLGDMRFGQYYIIFLMGAVNSFLLLMLSDISDPFDGFWHADLTAFSEFVEMMQADLQEAEQPRTS
jgi:hypothetical protein